VSPRLALLLRNVNVSQLLLRDAQFVQLRGDIGTVRANFDLLVDIGDLAILADEKRRPAGKLPRRIVDPVGRGRLTTGVAQNWVIQLECLGILRIGFDGVAARGEISNVVLIEPGALRRGDVKFPTLGRRDGKRCFNGAGTQRATLLRSATGKCFGEPSHNHWLFAFEIGQ